MSHAEIGRCIFYLEPFTSGPPLPALGAYHSLRKDVPSHSGAQPLGHKSSRVSLHWGQTSKKQGSPLPPSVVLCLGQAAPHRNYFSPCAENTLACFPPQCRRVESEPGCAHRSGLVVSSRGCKNRHRQLGQVRPSPGDAL